MRKQSDNPDVGHSAGQLDCLFKSQRAGEGARRGGRLFKGRKKTTGEMDWTRIQRETIITLLGQLRNFNVIESDIRTFLFIFSDVMKLLLYGDYS